MAWARQARGVKEDLPRGPHMRQGKAALSLEAELPGLQERALLAAEAARAANREELELDDADY
eukprot:13805902-Alexandrium_andersonii.AAC.1